MCLKIVDSDLSLRPIWDDKEVPDVVDQMHARTVFQQDNNVISIVLKEVELSTQRARVLQKFDYAVPVVIDLAFAFVYEVDEGVSYELSDQAQREYEYEARKGEAEYDKVNEFLLLKSLEELHAEALRLVHDFMFKKDSDMLRVALSTILAKPFLRKDVRKEVPKEKEDLIAPHLNTLVYVGVNSEDVDAFHETVLADWANELKVKLDQYGDKFVAYVNKTKQVEINESGEKVKRNLRIKGLDDDIIAINLEE